MINSIIADDFHRGDYHTLNRQVKTLHYSVYDKAVWNTNWNVKKIDVIQCYDRVGSYIKRTS